MRLTARGVVLLVLSVLLLAVAEWAGYPLFRVMGAAGLAAVVAAVVVTARGLRVDVSREIYPDRVERGRPALAKLTIRNLAGRRQRGFDAWDKAGVTVQTVRVRSLAQDAEATYRYELPTGRRGRLPVGPLTLHRVDPFGLARNRLSAGETAELWVHPRRYPARALIGGYPRHHHEGRTTDSLRGSLDIRDVREYQPGDEVRHLHWKATARTGRMMVRDYADPQQPRFTLLLDTRRASFTPEVFEEAVDLAASLLHASAMAGHHTRLVGSGGLDLTTAGGPLGSRLLLDELCQVGQDAGETLVTRELAAARDQGGCLMAVTTGRFDGLTALRPRYSSLFLVDLAAAEPIVVPGVRVLNAADAAHAVRRWNEVAG